MNNTALRAEVRSTNNTHMVFANEEHEKFYYEKLEKARYQDCYHKALIYILGISEDTRSHFSQIYDIKSGYIKTECLHQGWQASRSVRVVRLAFNLYTNGTPSVDDYKRTNDEELEPDHGILEHEEGINLMPGNIELSGLEVSLVNVMSRELVLRSYIEQVRDAEPNHCYDKFAGG